MSYFKYIYQFKINFLLIKYSDLFKLTSDKKKVTEALDFFFFPFRFSWWLYMDSCRILYYVM